METQEIPMDEYIKLWEKVKGNMRLPMVERYPWETDEEYKARCAEVWNPKMPGYIRWIDFDGEKVIKPKPLK